MRLVVLAGVFLIGVCVAWWQLRGPSHGQPVTRSAEAKPVATSQAASIPAAMDRTLPLPASTPTMEVAPLPATETMALARQEGDDRAPPIDRPEPSVQDAGPTAWDLSDPARYQDYEAREQQRVKSAYLQASDAELPKWRAALAEARARGATPEEIAAAEEKIRRLEMTQEALRNDDQSGDQ